MEKAVLAIVNPKAGTLKNKSDLLQKMVLAFEESPSGWDKFVVQETTHAGHATALAIQASKEGYSLVLAMGGDGTMNEVAKGLLYTDTALGIIPLGSGNGLARHLKIPMDPLMAFQKLLSGKIEKMDSGMANGTPFFLACGIGFEGVVAHAFSQQKTRGFSQYLLSAFRAFWSFSPLRIQVQADTGLFQERTIFTQAVCNGNQYGNHAIISPHSSLQDGLLNLATVFPFSVWASSGLFFRLMTGRLINSKVYNNLTCKEINITSAALLKGHVDGEPVDFANKLTVCIQPRSLKVCLPSDTENW